MQPPLAHPATAPLPSEAEATPRRTRGWGWLLLLPPYAALSFPALYNRATPSLFGFPFFYWYQLCWVIATSILLGVFYQWSLRRNR